MTSTLASAATPAPRSPPRARPLRCRSCGADRAAAPVAICEQCLGPLDPVYDPARARSEEHTSELQSLAYLVCRLLLEKKKNILRTEEHTSELHALAYLLCRLLLEKKK